MFPIFTLNCKLTFKPSFSDPYLELIDRLFTDAPMMSRRCRKTSVSCSYFKEVLQDVRVEFVYG